MICRIFLIAFLFCSYTFPSIANNDVQLHEIGTDIVIENKVLILELDVEGFRMNINWLDEFGNEFIGTHYARIGKHAYELRPHNHWNGIAQKIYTDRVEPVSADYRHPTTEDLIDIALAPEPMIVTSVNFLYGYYFWGHHHYKILMFVGFLLSGLFFIFTKMNPSQIILVSTLILLGFVDIHAITDHIRQIYNIDFHTPMSYASQVRDITKTMKNTFKGNKSWQFNNIKWPYTTLLSYYLAEYPHVDNNSSKRPSFIINQDGQRIDFQPIKETK